MFKWIRKLIANYRIKRFRCPYCNEPQYRARYFLNSSTPTAGSAIFCKRMHHGYLYESSTSDPLTLSFRQLDGGGEPIDIPNLTMTWGDMINKKRWR